MYLELFTLALILLLLYIYGGYLYLLQFMLLRGFGIRGSLGDSQSGVLRVTVLVTVHNEADVIRERIDNLLDQDYPQSALEVLVASDGSTDGTDGIVAQYGDDRVKLLRTVGRQGKTTTQNLAVPLSTGEVIIFTDAATIFDRGFVRNIVNAFADPAVGGADGHLLFITQLGNPLSQAQGYYWKYELRLRDAESRLGILAVGSGACLAVRRTLFCEMNPAIGEDCIVPLDVVAQGYRMVHVTDAIAYDHIAHSAEREFQTRVRMTLRNWQGTWSRPRLLNPFFYPGYAFALWSHKLLRWLSPLLMIALTLGVLIGAVVDNLAMQAALVGLIIFYCLALVGWAAQRWQWRIPVVATIYSFMVANAGFFVGVSKALRGKKIYKYR